MLAQLDNSYAVVKRIIGEESPVAAKMEKIRQLREAVLIKIEGLLLGFDQAAQDKEKDLVDRMARLWQLRSG